MSKTIIIIGAGLAGLSAALQAAEMDAMQNWFPPFHQSGRSLLWRRAVSTQL